MKFKITCRPRIRNSVAQKLISSSLIIGMSFNTFLPSLASTISEDGRYETFEDNNITIPNILEEDKIDVEIEGNTLVNLVQFKDKQLYSVSGNNRIERVVNGDFCTYRTIENTSSYITIRTGSHEVIKPNTTYTICFTIKKNTLPNYNGFSIRTVSDAFFSGGDTSLYYNNDYLLTEGTHKVTITTHSDISSYTGIGIGFKPIGENCPENLEFIIGEIMVLEGDWTDKEVPSYFEGMKSVGQNDNGSHKIEILSTNKNLFRKDLVQKGNISGAKHDFGIEINHPNGYKRTDFIKIKPNTNYSVSINTDIFRLEKKVLYDINKNVIKEVGNTFVSENAYYLRVVFAKTVDIETEVSDEILLQHNIQIEEGNSTSYVKGERNKKEILLNEPLRSVGDVEDRIIKRNGQWVVERNYDEIILDGSDDEVWQWSSDVLWRFKTPKKHYACEVSDDGYEYGNGASDKYPQVQAIIGGLDYAFKVQAGYLQFRNKEYADGDINLWRNYLKSNPIRVIYQLDKPIYEPIEYGPLTLYKNTTHISNNSVIPATMKVTVDRVSNRAIESVELAKTNPNMENLSRARMWINLIDDSTLKDQLQDEVNSITNIDDLQLERKSASSNLDVYVKSQNMLSMSLNTNSVTFDGYSGTEDMEKLGAVNISIDSSLPYSLNAYMPSEIANSDKSETMPIDILNIRDSSEGIYKTFDNTTDKIILKDSCNTGNDLVHNIDLKLASNLAHKADVYKTVIKFEAEQK